MHVMIVVPCYPVAPQLQVLKIRGVDRQTSTSTIREAHVFSRQAVRGAVLRRAIGVAGAVVAMWAGAQSAGAQSLAEPPVFASHNGVLDIMMVAIPQPIPTISFTPPNSHSAIHPTGWVYQICPRPASGLSCLAGSSTVSPYGGTRLALQQGDTLKIRFVNRLPKLNPDKLNHETDPGEANLFLNP